jgi:pyruvate kinase
MDGLILKEEITMADKYDQILKILKEILPQVEVLSDNKTKYEELSKFFKLHREYSIDPTIESLLDCAVKTSFDLNVGLIILYTDNYKLAKCLSKFRPKCRIVCVTNQYKYFNFLRLIRGVTPFLFDNFSDLKLKGEEFTKK